MLKYQIFFGAIVLLIIIWNIFSFKRGEIRLRRFFIFISFWLFVLLAIIFPEETNKIAKFFNITRGADFFIYISIIVIFYTLFKIYEKIEQIERNITKIVREIALIKKDREDNF
ncbi:MAG: DUF2304 family protein [Proteobacteria bacterium]|nr:DUF2304 family protein [Pseudomonadota bacterium]